MEDYSDADFLDSDYTSTASFSIKKDEILDGESSKYQIEKFLGKGAFGKVAQCIKLDTNEKVAVKIVEDKNDGILEMLMSQEIRKLDPDKNNLVRLIERFQHRGHICLALEMLDISIRDYMLDRKFKPLPISEIQTITRQVLVALNSLKSIGVVHTDISINNIMLVNHQLQPFKVKLIDFGLARPVWLLKELRGEIMQPVLYRAPEVILGLELNEAIDMWSFGCALTVMYLGNRKFPKTELEVISIIVKTQGQPSDHLLDSGIFSKVFFQKINDSSGSSWKLIRHAVREAANEDRFNINHPELKHIFECEDTQAFLWLLKQMLNVDPEKRINPSEALKSHFITKQNICRKINPIEKLPLLYFLKMLWQLEELSAKFKSTVKSREVGPQIDDSCSGDKKTLLC
ncbi:hypothetical protein Q5P01_008038 [Channa striata]|uniref:Protein kinase domain-containing protein n=1 Tax=Channa striata TaxID=64152 RepID=A0AA88NAC2_CHASR|nr:hypothetical protein Q5P01_008038 [Channa striata]